MFAELRRPTLSASMARQVPKFIPMNSKATCGSIVPNMPISRSIIVSVTLGNIHVNGVENVWSLFKRGVLGVFHKVSEKYLPLYLSEFEFRFNHRKEQGSMFDMVLQTSF